MLSEEERKQLEAHQSATTAQLVYVNRSAVFADHLVEKEKWVNLVVGLDKSIHRGNQLFNAAKTGPAQRLLSKNAEPDLDLIEP